MEISFAVHVSQGLKGLKGDISDLMMGKFSLFLKQLIHISMHIFEDKVKLVIFFDEFEKLNDVGVM